MGHEPLNVFISYSHKDKEFKDRLIKHLSSLIRQKYIRLWYDNMIQPGDDLDESVMEALHGSQIMLLLISADYLASEYCYEKELKEAMRMREEQEMIVIPIMVKPVDVKGTLFDGIVSLPTDRKAVTLFSNREEAYEDIAKGIRKVVENRAFRQLPQFVTEKRKNSKESTGNFANPSSEAEGKKSASVYNNYGIHIGGNVYGDIFHVEH